MPKPKKIKGPVRVSVVLEKEELDHLKQVILRWSLHEGKCISVSEVIRDALKTMYPMNTEQLSLLTELK